MSLSRTAVDDLSAQPHEVGGPPRPTGVASTRWTISSTARTANSIDVARCPQWLSSVSY